MAFNNETWEFSNVTKAEVKTAFPKPEEGDRYLKITDAYYDKDSFKYTISVLDLGNEAKFSLSYWISSVNEDGEVVDNAFARNTLITLGAALAGSDIGVPNPACIIGGVVLAHIKLKPSKKDPTKKYARCEEYDAVPYDIAILADIEQYSIDGPTGEEE